MWYNFKQYFTTKYQRKRWGVYKRARPQARQVKCAGRWSFFNLINNKKYKILISCQDTYKNKFDEVGTPDFYTYVPVRYVEIRRF